MKGHAPITATLVLLHEAKAPFSRERHSFLHDATPFQSLSSPTPPMDALVRSAFLSPKGEIEYSNNCLKHKSYSKEDQLGYPTDTKIFQIPLTDLRDFVLAAKD